MWFVSLFILNDRSRSRNLETRSFLLEFREDGLPAWNHPPPPFPHCRAAVNRYSSVARFYKSFAVAYSHGYLIRKNATRLSTLCNLSTRTLFRAFPFHGSYLIRSINLANPFIAIWYPLCFRVTPWPIIIPFARPLSSRLSSTTWTNFSFQNRASNRNFDFFCLLIDPYWLT